MADPTFQVHYRKNQIATFEQRYSALRVACTQEAVIKGDSAVFQVSGSGGATAVTRGANGEIPYFITDNTQYTCSLVESHAPFKRTKYNIFATQGDQQEVMQTEAVGTLNRDIDQSIIDQLDTATQTTGSAAKASVDMVMHAITILGNNDVDCEEGDNMYGIVSPAFMSYIEQTPEFSSKDYVSVQPFMGPSRKMLRWKGVNWIKSTRITGKGTASEKCYLLHKRAMGHAANSQNMEVVVGYNEEQDYTFSRATLYHNAKLLQNSAIVQMLHDGSEYAAS